MSHVQPQSTRSCFCRHIAHSHVSSLAPLPLVTDRFLFRHISHSHVSLLDPPSTRHGQVSVQTHISQSCITSSPVFALLSSLHWLFLELQHVPPSCSIPPHPIRPDLHPSSLALRVHLDVLKNHPAATLVLELHQRLGVFAFLVRGPLEEAGETGQRHVIPVKVERLQWPRNLA